MSVQILEQDLAAVVRNETTQAIEVMAGISPVGTADDENLGQEVLDEIVATLGFAGTNQGIFVLSTNQETAKTICAAMLCMEVSELDGLTEVSDGVGEILNMIAGNFKNAWLERGNKMEITIPSVSFGKPITFSTGKSLVTGYAAVVEYECGKLRIEARFYD